MSWRVVVFSRRIVALGAPRTRIFLFALACSSPSSLLLCLRLEAWEICFLSPTLPLEICWFPLSSRDAASFLAWIFTAVFATDRCSANAERSSSLRPVEEQWEASRIHASTRWVEDAWGSLRNICAAGLVLDHLCSTGPPRAEMMQRACQLQTYFSEQVLFVLILLLYNRTRRLSSFQCRTRRSRGD